MLTALQVREFSAEFGSSFYLLDLDIALANYRQLLTAGASAYTSFGIAYSVKTNYTPALCRMFTEHGALLEVVSEMEYDLALSVGQKPAEIIVNGPVHTSAFIGRILSDGALINLDSFNQLLAVEEFARQNPGQSFRLGIRLMLGLSSCKPSRFGFPAEEIALQEVAERLRNLPNAQLVALHCHFCEDARDTASYQVRGQQMLQLREEYFADFPIEIFNLGGGFYSKMPPELKEQFTDHIPEFGVYADALCQPFVDAFPDEPKPQLLIEPGNAVVADAMQFYCPLVDIKNPEGRTIGLLDGSIFDIKPTRNRKNLPLKFLAMGGEQQQVQNCELTGFTCLEDDVLYSGFSGLVSIGDYAVFSNTGAYTNVMRPPFIRPAPAIVAKKGDNYFLAKKAGTMGSVFADYLKSSE